MNEIRSEAATDVPSAASATKQRFPLGRWTPFRTAPVASPFRPPSPPQPVQKELTLDDVKPVRNDLAHADLVVVRSEGKPLPAVATARAAKPDPAEPVWSRVKTQFFGMQKA